MFKSVRSSLALLIALVLALMLTGCVGQDSPLSFLTQLQQGQPAPGAQPQVVTATPTLPPPPAAAGSPTPTLPPPPAAIVSATPIAPQGVVGGGDAVVSSGSNVNLRGGPGTNYNVLGVVGSGEALDVLGRNPAASWFRVQTAEGAIGWIYGGLITLSVDIGGIPLAEAPPPPEPQQPAAGGETGGETGGSGQTGGPLQIGWSIVGVPTIDEKDAYHTIAIIATGGSGQYTYYWNNQPLGGNTVVHAAVRCGGYVPASIRVDSSDGQSVTQQIGFNAFCPTPWGCNDCDLWSP